MDNSIQPTNYVPDFIRKAKLEDKEEASGNKLNKRDKAFALLSDSDGWGELKEYIQSRVESIRSLTDYNPDKVDYTELGQRFAVADTVARELERIIFKVENAGQALKEQEK